jgi:hypothetical protein
MKIQKENYFETNKKNKKNQFFKNLILKHVQFGAK